MSYLYSWYLFILYLKLCTFGPPSSNAQSFFPLLPHFPTSGTTNPIFFWVYLCIWFLKYNWTITLYLFLVHNIVIGCFYTLRKSSYHLSPYKDITSSYELYSHTRHFMTHSLFDLKFALLICPSVSPISLVPPLLSLWLTLYCVLSICPILAPWKWNVSCSILSESLQPHGLQPTRVLCPWNSPSKNAGVGCHSFLQGIFLTQGSNPGLPHCSQVLYHPTWATREAHPGPFHGLKLPAQG